MSPRAATPRSKTPAALTRKKPAGSLPKEFEAALLDSTVDELRAYLRDLAGRQKPIRADFLLFRTTATGSDDRASYVSAIRLGLKQPPRLARRRYYEDPLTAAEKRLYRFEEIADVMLHTAQQHLTDRADLPAARAIVLAVLEVELTDLDADSLHHTGCQAEAEALIVVQGLWHALPTREARERLFEDLLTLLRTIDDPTLPPCHRIIETLLGFSGITPAQRLAALAVLDTFLTRLPTSESDANATYMRLTGWDPRTHQLEQLVKLKVSALEALQRDEDLLTTLQAYEWLPAMRTRRAEALLQRQRGAEARQVLQEGLELIKKMYSPLRQPWQTLLLQAEQQTANTPGLRQLALEILTATRYRDLAAYQRLRDSYEPAEWPAGRQHVLDKYRARMLPSVSREFIELELAEVDLYWSAADGNLPRVVELLGQLRSVPLLDAFAQQLWPTHALELAGLYEALLPEYIAANNHRQLLEGAVATMRRIARLPGQHEAMAALVASLRTRFPRRTVLEEVLTAGGF